MTITTVDQLVKELQRRSVRFSVDAADQIRSDAIVTLCPLEAAAARGMNCDASFELVESVVNAADNVEGHDPAVREKLLTLVEVLVA